MLDRRMVLAAGALLPISIASPAWSQATPVAAEDLDRIRKRAASFFERIVALSVASSPPGLNASNGWFVKAMQGDGELAIAQRPISTDSPGGAVCADLTQAAMKACRDGFAPGLYKSSGLTNLRLAMDVFNAALPSLLEISAKIVAAVYTGGATGAAISQDVNQQVSSLGEAVKGRGIVTNGEHANGWISSGVRDGANGVIGRIDQAKGALSADGRDSTLR